MYNLKLFRDPFFLDFFDVVNDTPRFVNRTIKRTNINENDNEYIVEPAVPGLNKEDISVKVKDSILTISHENEKDDETFYFTNSFTKEYTLPDDINVKNVNAKVDRGVLTINIPKDKKKLREHIIELQ